MNKEIFLKNGIGMGILVDQMTILAEEAKILKEEVSILRIRAAHYLEVTEAIREKYGLVR